MAELPTPFPTKAKAESHPTSSNAEATNVTKTVDSAIAKSNSNSLTWKRLFHKDLVNVVREKGRRNFWLKNHKIAETIILTGRVMASHVYHNIVYLYLDDGTGILKVKLHKNVFEECNTDIEMDSDSLLFNHYQIHGQFNQFMRDKTFYVIASKIYQTSFDGFIKGLKETCDVYDRIQLDLE